MTKSKFISIFIAIIVGACLALGAAWWLVRNIPVPVTFNYADDVSLVVNIYRVTSTDEHNHATQTETKPVKTVSGSGVVSLIPGHYVAESASTEKYTTVHEDFIVPDRKTIEINPNLTKEHLNAIYIKERPALTRAVTERFTDFSSRGFEVKSSALYKNGEWASVTVSSDDVPDYFHIILKKEKRDWVVVTEPSLIISTPDYPDIPRDILESINARRYYEVRYRS